MISTFLVSFGFFGAIIFLPRWFQVVRLESATNSGYLIFPMLIGLIASSMIAGVLVSKTGKYKMYVIAGLGLMTAGILLMTQLRADTDYLALFFWMFVTGLGIGPTLSVFTIIVQNAVPFSKLGVATSNLTFFRQIGGSVGLAIAGTVFGQALEDELPNQLIPVAGQAIGAAPADQQAALGGYFQSLASSNLDLNNQTGVGQSLGQVIRDGAPADLQGLLAPFVAQFDTAFGNAMSLAIAQTFWIAVGATILALFAALVMRELPLRRTVGPEPAHEGPAGRTGVEAHPPLPAAD
jgi:MFS family permease